MNRVFFLARNLAVLARLVRFREFYALCESHLLLDCVCVGVSLGHAARLGASPGVFFLTLDSRPWDQDCVNSVMFLWRDLLSPYTSTLPC